MSTAQWPVGGANRLGRRSLEMHEDIAKQDYILTPGRYVGIEEQEDDGEPFEEKMARLTGELSEMFKRSHELEEEIRKRLGAIGYDMTFDNSEIIICQTGDGRTKIDVRMEDEAVWLTQSQMAELFQTTKQNISLHNKQRLATLNRMVSAFFDLAELRAMQHQPMYMRDWVVELDDFAKRYGKGILPNAVCVLCPRGVW